MFDSSTPLLQHGNSKLGRAIHVWSIPAVDTCPGSTAVCRKLCYALRHRFRFDSVKRRLAWNREQCERQDFVERTVGSAGFRVECVAGQLSAVLPEYSWIALEHQR